MQCTLGLNDHIFLRSAHDCCYARKFKQLQEKQKAKAQAAPKQAAKKNAKQNAAAQAKLLKFDPKDISKSVRKFKEDWFGDLDDCQKELQKFDGKTLGEHLSNACDTYSLIGKSSVEASIFTTLRRLISVSGASSAMEAVQSHDTPVTTSSATSSSNAQEPAAKATAKAVFCLF